MKRVLRSKRDSVTTPCLLNRRLALTQNEGSLKAKMGMFLLILSKSYINLAEAKKKKSRYSKVEHIAIFLCGDCLGCVPEGRKGSKESGLRAEEDCRRQHTLCELGDRTSVKTSDAFSTKNLEELLDEVALTRWARGGLLTRLDEDLRVGQTGGHELGEGSDEEEVNVRQGSRDSPGQPGLDEEVLEPLAGDELDHRVGNEEESRSQSTPQ